MGFKKYLTSTLFLALTYNHFKFTQAEEPVQNNKKLNPNKIGDSVIYFRVAAKIDDKNTPDITGKEGMWCYKDDESYKKSLIHDRATKTLCTPASDFCHCGDTAGNPCAAQIVVETESTTEDAFDKRMCNGCIYKLKLLDLFEYSQNTDDQTDTAKILTDYYLYIKFYKAVHIEGGVTEAKAHILDSATVDPETASPEIYRAITEENDKKPLILLESGAMLHFFKDVGGCETTDKGLMVKSTGNCGTGATAKSYPTTINFQNCNPTTDGTPETSGHNPLLEAIGKPLWRAEISKTPYGCYTKFRLLPKAYFIEDNEPSGSANPKYRNPCGESFEQDEITDECGSMDEDGDSCIARFRGVSNKDRTKDNKELDDEDLPRNNCGNCYVVRLWTRSVNPHFKIREHHNIEMKVKVYGEASYRDGGEYEQGKRDYRLPMRDEDPGDSDGSTVTDVAKVANLTGLNRDIELLWEPVKNSYKNLCKDGNCRLCVDEKVTELLVAAKSDKLRKEINAPAQDPRQTPEYGFKMEENDSDLAGDGFELTDSDSKKYKRPFKHFIHIKNDEFGELDYEGGEDECGKGFVEWKEVCFESDSKLRFTSGEETCGNNDEKKIKITKGGNYRESNVTSDAFAATMMLLVGTENLDGMVVGPCHACSV